MYLRVPRPKRSPWSYRCRILVLFGLWTTRAITAWGADDPQHSDHRAEAYIERLRSADFEDRKDGEANLRLMGFQARPALLRALATAGDPELQQTLERLLTALGRASLRIEAVRSNGTPIPETELQIQVTPLTAQARAGVGTSQNRYKLTTDAKGHACLKGFWAGALLKLDIDWAQRYPTCENLRSEFIRLHPGTNRLRYVLSEGTSLRGLVLDMETNKAVDGALVSISRKGESTHGLAPRFRRNVIEIKGTTGIEGTVELPHLPSGPLTLKVSHKDYFTVIRQQQITPSKPVAPFTLRLIPKKSGAGGIELTVLDRSGKPWAGQAFRIDLKGHPAQEAEAESMKNKMQTTHRWPVPKKNPNHTHISDPAGRLKIGGLRPGSYWLRILPQQKNIRLAIPLILPNVAVSKGATKQLGSLQWPKGSAIAVQLTPFKTSSQRTPGTGLQVLPDSHPETELFLKAPHEFSTWRQFRSWEPPGAPFHIPLSSGPGGYQALPVAPGKYALCLFRGGRLARVIRGIEVEDGQTTRLTLPSLNEKESAARPSMTVQGIVREPDGKPVPKGYLLIYGNGRRIINCPIKDGQFSSQGQSFQETPTLLVCALKGFEPFAMRLDKGADLSRLKVRLRHPAYGKIRVVVRDGSDRPLPGTLVSIQPGFHLNPRGYLFSQREPRPSPLPKTTTTNRKGEAFLAGLAVGTRTCLLSLDGYYSTGHQTAIIRPGRITELTIRMLAGRDVHGTLTTPSGYPPEKALIYLLRKNWRGTYYETASVNTNGTFTLKGLKPGNVRIIAQYPGLVQRTHLYRLPENGAVPPLHLKLVRPGQLTLDLGSDFASQRVELQRSLQWHPVLRSMEDPIPSTRTTRLNKKGQGSLQELIPGTYDLLIAQPSPNITGLDGAGGGTTVLTKRLLKDILITSKDKVNQAHQIRTSTLSRRLRPGTGSVSGRFTFKGTENIPLHVIRARLVLTLVGSDATGVLTLNASEPRTERIPVKRLKGEEIPAWRLDPNRFTFSEVPPGSYGLYAHVEAGDPGDPNMGSLRGPAHKVRVFTLGENEMLSFGEVVLEPSIGFRAFLRKRYDALWGESAPLGPDRFGTFSK